MKEGNPRRGNRRLRALSWALIVCALTFAGLSSCAWKVVPPAHLAEPVPVYLSEYGRHTRLALPDGASAFLEYGFGEWNFYGLEKEGAWSALRAITGFGEGALSRRELPYTRVESNFAKAAGSSRSAQLLVERSLAENLREELESRWRSNAGFVTVRAWDQIPVSRDPARYHLFGNSNHAVANWLRRLGCRIRGCPITSNFQVMGSDAAGRRSPRRDADATPW
jgi:hypothetical protein